MSLICWLHYTMAIMTIDLLFDSIFLTKLMLGKLTQLVDLLNII